MCTLQGNDLWVTKLNEQITAAAALSLSAPIQSGWGSHADCTLHPALHLELFRSTGQHLQTELEQTLPVGEQGCFSIAVSSSFSK